MQGLLYSQLLGSPGLVKDGRSTGWHAGCSRSALLPLPLSLLVLFQSGLKPPDGLTNVDSPTLTGDLVDNLGVFLLGKSVLDPGQHGTERLSRLKDHSEIVPTQSVESVQLQSDLQV